MTEEIAVSYRGQEYVFGEGADFLGIWRRSDHELVLIERWPATTAGWFGAWSRFHELEARPETVSDHPVSDDRHELPPRGLPPRWPLILLAAGIFCGVAGLFAPYLGGSALTAEADQLVPHLCYLATWAIAATMLAATRRWAQAGAAIGFGVSVLSLGFFLNDVAEVVVGGAHLAGAGLVLGTAGWLLCASGSTVALATLWRSGILVRPGKPNYREIIPAAVLGIGAAVSFAPAWDRFVLHASVSGQTAVFTAGNAFSNAGMVIATNLVTMVLIALAPVLAMLWRPRRLGVFLLAGALVPVGAQVAAALVGLASVPSPSTFGISPTEAIQAGVSISPGVTAVFWVYSAFVLGLIGLGLFHGLQRTPWGARARAFWSRTTKVVRRPGSSPAPPRPPVSPGAPLPTTAPLR